MILCDNDNRRLPQRQKDVFFLAIGKHMLSKERLKDPDMRYNIQLFVYDDKWTAEAGRVAVERLVYQDKVQFMISTIS
jgi:hypothetical protein